MSNVLKLDTVDAGEDFKQLFFLEKDKPKVEAEAPVEPAVSIGSDLQDGSDLTAILAGEADPKEVEAEAAKTAEDNSSNIEHLLETDAAILEDHAQQQSDIDTHIAQEAERAQAAAEAVRLAEEEAARIEA